MKRFDNISDYIHARPQWKSWGGKKKQRKGASSWKGKKEGKKA